MKRILLVTTVLFGLFGHALHLESQLLVTFVTGGPIQYSNPSLRTLCSELKPYITAHKAKEELIHYRDLMNRTPADYSEYTHLAFIGHSLGGMQAHSLARTLALYINFKEILLITLDPVSNLFPGDQPSIQQKSKPGQPDTHRPRRWVNVYSKKPYFHPRWKHEPFANRNKWYYLPHNQAKWMFVGEVRSEFMEFIGGPIQVDSNKRLFCNFS